MTIYALWHGGSSYAHGDVETDVETFPSIRAAVDALQDRSKLGHGWQMPFYYADGRTARVYTPNADDSSMWLWFADPRGNADPYPDRVLSFGPRGGVRVERA